MTIIDNIVDWGSSIPLYNNMIDFLILSTKYNKMMLLSIIIFMIILSPTVLIAANGTENRSFSNLDLSLSLRSNQLTISQANYLALGGAIYYGDVDSARTITRIRYANRNPEVCFMLGFFPGFFIHGLSHYYIGDYWNGSYLLLGEAASVGLVFYGGLTNAFSNSSKGDGMFIPGLCLFFFTWVYDWIAATVKVKKAKKQQSLIIVPSLKNNKVGINLTLGVG